MYFSCLIWEFFNTFLECFNLAVEKLAPIRAVHLNHGISPGEI